MGGTMTDNEHEEHEIVLFYRVLPHGICSLNCVFSQDVIQCPLAAR